MNNIITTDESITGCNNNFNECNVNVMVKTKSYTILEDIENKVPIDCVSINRQQQQQQCLKNKLNEDLMAIPPLNCDNATKDRDDLPICRICHCSDDSELITVISASNTGDCSSPESAMCPSTTLITPCFCSGSLRYVHHYCLQQWIRSSNHKYCELCKFHFKLTVKSKPLHKWESLDMSASERRKLVCNLIFNMISMFCVFWSIYVLIERATIEARYGMLDWPFWTKMLVVTIGFLGGTIFLFVQLRLYISILLRWRQFNRIIIIENAPPKDKIKQQSVTISTISNGQLQK